MTGEVFEAWFAEVVKKVPRGTVFVMNNAAYHTRVTDKAPTSRDKKDVILQWLLQHNINVPQRALKRELLALVK